MWLLSFMEDTEHFYRFSRTYLHKAEASVSNEDRPHGTTAHTCCTVASSGTNYKDKQRDKLHSVANAECTFNQMCRKLFYPESLFCPLHSLTHSPGPPQ